MKENYVDVLESYIIAEYGYIDWKEFERTH